MPAGQPALALGSAAGGGVAVPGSFALGDAALAGALALARDTGLALGSTGTSRDDPGDVGGADAASGERLAQLAAKPLTSQTKMRVEGRGDTKSASFTRTLSPKTNARSQRCADPARTAHPFDETAGLRTHLQSNRPCGGIQNHMWLYLLQATHADAFHAQQITDSLEAPEPGS